MSAAAIRVVVDADGMAGFLDRVSGVFITDPFTSSCGRFPVDPEKEYGIDLATALLIVEDNSKGDPS